MSDLRAVLDGPVALDAGAADRVPGYVAAVRRRGVTEVLTGGVATLGGPAMGPDALFRIASLTKPMGAALALTLVQDGLLDLDDAVGRWLPEIADPRVLVTPDAPLDRTVASPRPITVRHLLTMTCGWGVVFDATPLRAAMGRAGLAPGPGASPLTADEFVAGLGALPLAFAPGDGWLYDTGTDVLGVLLARATGIALSTLLAERVTGPLGMTDTAFRAVDPARLTTAYRPGPDGLEVADPADGDASRPPRFERLSAGIVSSAGDVLRFFTSLADDDGVLTAASRRLMTADALTDDQRRQARPIVGPGASWGLGCAVDVAVESPWQSVGRWGWSGGSGTTAFVDPARDTVAVRLTQRAMTGPRDVPEAFWTAVAAPDDQG